MYTLVTVDWLGTKFEVYNDSQIIGTIVNKVPWLKYRSIITVNDTKYIAYRESLMGKWLFSSNENNAVIATAIKPSFFTDKFIIQYNSQELSLSSPQLSIKNYFIIERNNIEIGMIKRPGLVTNKWVCTISDDIPAEIIHFMFYLSRIVISSRSS